VKAWGAPGSEKASNRSAYLPPRKVPVFEVVSTADPFSMPLRVERSRDGGFENHDLPPARGADIVRREELGGLRHAECVCLLARASKVMFSQFIELLD
jgi:hypothetical protein